MRILSKKEGFTLIEILVSLSIFSLVVVVAAGALLTAMDGNRKTQGLKSVLNNLNFALESITREVRVGSEYGCDPADCEKTLTFTSSDGKLIMYKFNFTDNSTDGPGGDHPNPTGQIFKSVDGGDAYEVTAPEVKIEDVHFYIEGESSGDSEQPKVFMTVNGYAGVKLRNRSHFNLQTTITQRLRDVN
jgi:prepilin-type N-terminal cleavage/methylation domain-containing protein